jgi:acyl-CoA thioester hydrolase
MTAEAIYSIEVPESWTDHYGHMNEGYYVVAASDASWAFQALLGIGTDYYDATGLAMVTVETHVRYLDEVNRGETLTFDSMILGYESRKVHVGHVMRVGEKVCATLECLWLHLNHKEGGLGHMSDAVQAKLKAHLADPLPDWAGRQISMKKKA